MAYYGYRSHRSFTSRLATPIGATLGIGMVAAVIACIYGWFANLFTVIGAFVGAESITQMQVSGKLILQVIGVFFAPLGSIMGLFF